MQLASYGYLDNRDTTLHLLISLGAGADLGFDTNAESSLDLRQRKSYNLGTNKVHALDHGLVPKQLEGLPSSRIVSHNLLSLIRAVKSEIHPFARQIKKMA